MKRLYLGLSILVACITSIMYSDVAWAGAIHDGANIRVSDAGLTGNAEAIRMVEQDGKLYAVWEDNRDGNFRGVYFAKSVDGGSTWGPNIRVHEMPYDDWINNPDIAVQPDGTIWVVWHTYYAHDVNNVNDLRLAKSIDGGATFTVVNLFDGTDRDSNLWRARIVSDASNGGLYIMSQLYAREGSDEGTELFLIRYVPATDTFEGTIINDVALAGRIGDSAQDYGPWFSLTARAGKICAAWEDRGRNVDERLPIYGACSTDGGVTFGTNFKISPDDGMRPEIALGPDGELYAAYSIDTDANNNIKMRLSTDDGATWQSERIVTTVDSYEMRHWDIEVDANGQVALTYVYDLGSTSDLYLATSVDQGLNFSYLGLEDGQGLYPATADQYEPTLALGGTGEETRAYVAWEDDRNTKDELWSQRLILDGLPPTAPTNVTTAPAERAIHLSWTAATDSSGIAGYRLYRATTAQGPFTEITTQLVSSTSFVDVELDTATYFYQVAAVDRTGNTGPLSAVVSGAAATAGEPTYGGRVAYESGENVVRIRSLTGDPDEHMLADARQPRFALNGKKIYYRSSISIASQPVEGGPPTNFFTSEGLYEYDLADNESHYAVLIGRTFPSTVIGGNCSVIEPNYGRPGQNLYSNPYDFASDIAISNDRKWLVYRTAGFCTAGTTGVYYPPRLYLIDLATSEETFPNDGFEYRTPNFSPTGHWLAFSVDYSGQEEIWKAQVQDDGSLGNYVQLSRGPANQPSRAPAWSTDGTWLVFQRDIDPTATENWQLFVVRNDGVGLRSLNIAGQAPAWLGGGSGGMVQPGAERIYLPTLTR